jgi:iron complex outermembrane recepter protein
MNRNVTGLPRPLVHLLMLGTATGALLASAPALAQVAPNPDQAAPSDANSAAKGSDEIIVTARRQSEKLSRVPISISRIGSEELVQRSVTSQADLQRSVPGLTVRSGQSDNVLTFTIRGQGVDTFSSSQPAVLTYFNDVPQSTFSASNFFDLESIQVLKGPQGTLFGRNTTGGAVLYTSAKPTDKLEGNISAGFGNYNDRRLEGMINLPLAGDQVLLRVAGNFQWRDGWQKNVTTGQEQGRIDRQSVRASLTIGSGGSFETTTVAGYSSLGGSNVGLYAYAVYPCGATNNGIPLGTAAACTYGPANPGYAAYLAANPGATPNGLVDQVDIQRALGNRRVNGNARTARKGEDWFVMNTSSLELSSNLTLKNIAAHSRSDVNNLWDPFGTGLYVVARLFSTPDPGPGTVIGFRQANSAYSEELQLSGKAGSLTYIIGGFLSSKRDYYTAPFEFFDFRPVFGPFFSAHEYNTYSKSQALYAQGTLDLSNAGLAGLKLTGGFRYTWEQVRVKTLPFSTNPGDLDERASFSDPSWTIGLEYQASEQLLLYVTQRGSFRAGGFNGQGPLLNAVASQGGNLFLPEKVRDIELGAKFSGRVGDVPVRANLALYSSKITDVQRAQFAVLPVSGQLATLTVNIPSARVRGLEFDGWIEPASGFQIGGNFAYTDARYLDGRSVVFGTTYDYGPYADTPEWAGGAFIRVAIPVPESVGEISIRGDVYAQSHQYFSNLADTIAPGTKLPNYALVNARIDWNNVLGSPISVSAFVKNAFQKDYFTGGFGFPPLGIASALPGEPRVYGMTAKFQF